MADINPFEPWRPGRSGDDSPGRLPDDDLLRPWRDAPRGDPEQDEGDPEWYRRSRAPEPAWTAEPPKRQGGVGAGFVWLTLVLIVVALIVWAANGGSHVSRIGAAGLALWAGLLFAMVIGRAWRWYGRLAWMLCGLLGMAACWAFVPTTQGHSLWDAESALARTRALAPGDTAAFAAQAKERSEVGQDFSRFREPFRSAERSWVTRTVVKEVNAADQERDPAAAQARLLAVQKALVGTEHYGQIYWDLHRGRQRAMTARLTKAEEDLNTRIEKKKHREVADGVRRLQRELGDEARELSLEPELNAKLAGVRERNFRAQARAAEVTLENLLREEKYADVAAVGRRLTAELQPEAGALGGQPGALDRLKQVRRAALLARVKLVQSDLDALLRKNDYESVAARARKVEEELADENAALAGAQEPNPAGLPGAFLPARETALARRAEKARKELESALAKKEYAAVAARGDAVMRELGPEGKALGKAAWGDPITAVRRKALAARLDLARQKTQEQLKKKQYQSMGETGEKAYTELSLEAEAVGLAAELEKFRGVCRFYAKLAKEGGEEDGK